MAQAVSPTSTQAIPLTRRIADGLWLRKWLVVGVLTAVTVAGAFYVRFANAPAPKSPVEKFADAMEYLAAFPDPLALRRAKKITRSLRAEDYQDHEFAGGVDYLTGAIAFHESRETDGVSREQKLQEAVKHLKKAERISLPVEHRGEWSYMLGVSLHELRHPSAQERLIEAARRLPPSDSRIADIEYRIGETDLDNPTPERIAHALKLNTELLHRVSDVEFRNRLRKQRIDLLILSSRTSEATELLKQIDDHDAPDSLVLRARSLIANRDFESALKLLKPLARAGGIGNDVTRTATWLFAGALEAKGDIPAALDDYLLLMRNHAQHAQGIAGAIRAADLLRAAGRNEESINAYETALKNVGNSEEYQNRWLPLAKLRERVLAAWLAWNAQRRFDDAYHLAEMMTPIVSREDQLRHLAETAQLHAAWSHQQWLSADAADKPALERTAYLKWRTSGKAHAALGDRVHDREALLDAVWKSAKHYRKGHDFVSALKQYDRVVAEDKTERLPLAMVRRAATLAAVGKLVDAEKSLREVIDQHEKSPVVFEARLELGRCLLEQNKPKEAREAWERLISEPTLTPQAREWREAMLELGRMAFLRRGLMSGLDLDPAKPPTADVANNLKNVADRFVKFVRRFPDEPEVIEARYLLARALAQHAAILRNRRNAAATANRVKQLTTEFKRELKRAIDELRLVQRDITRLEGQRTQKHSSIKKNTWHLLARCHFLREDWEEAISAYGDAIHHDPQSSGVLLAYAQMSRCYSALRRPEDAKSMLDQAEIILKQLPDAAFQGRGRLLSRPEWRTWLKFTRESLEGGRAKPAA